MGWFAQFTYRQGCGHALTARNVHLQVQACKRNMNTFAFVGDLEGSPQASVAPCLHVCGTRRQDCTVLTASVFALQVNCVYHSEEAENQFLRERAAKGQ